jgi:hypothetical protein
MTNGPPSQRDRRSLQDLAKLASSPSLGTKTPAPAPVAASKPELDSGIVDLKVIASADAGAATRAKTTPLASAPLFGDEAPAAGASSSSAEKVTAAAPSAPGSSPAAAASGARLPAPGAAGAATAPSKGPLTYVVVGLGLALVAAGGFMLVRQLKGQPHGLAPTSTESPVAATSPTPTTPSPPDSAAAAVPSAGETAPASPTTSTDTPQGLALHAGGTRKLPGTAPKAPPPAGPGVSGVSPLTASMAQVANQPTTPPPVAGELGQALEHAAGSGAATPAPAAQPSQPTSPQFAPGSVPEKPSQGAVTSAIQRALPDARSCLNSDDPPAKANITFASAGTVSSVVISGAAGAATESCIKKALSKASVPPFAQATYSANVTVRAN